VKTAIFCPKIGENIDHNIDLTVSSSFEIKVSHDPTEDFEEQIFVAFLHEPFPGAFSPNLFSV
jgi:hypothetical protein